MGKDEVESFSFDRMAALYDATRTVDAQCLKGALDFLVAAYPPAQFREAVYPGIGTGRIAIPLAQRGYRITGLDISPNMLDILAQRLRDLQPDLPVSFRTGDATTLPFSDGSFDMAIAVHLFYFIPDWRRAMRELLRTVRKDGPIVLMHTGHGAEVPLVNERYEAFCVVEGCAWRFPGARGSSDVLEYAATLGCRVAKVSGRWQWVSRISLERALADIRSRAYSFTSVTSDSLHARAVAMLESELADRFGSLSMEVKVPNEIWFAVLTR